MLNKKGMRFVFFTAQNLRINPQLPLHSVHRRWLLHTHSRLIIIRTYCEFVLGSCGFFFLVCTFLMSRSEFWNSQ